MKAVLSALVALGVTLAATAPASAFNTKKFNIKVLEEKLSREAR
jgi:hypothetical protein